MENSCSDEVIAQMIDMNAVIANNVLTLLKRTGATQNDLADALNIKKQTMRRMLYGIQPINATELLQIAVFFHVDVKELSRIPATNVPTNDNVARTFTDSFESTAAKEALEIADELADLIIFHAEVRAGAGKMMQPWED